jgi:ketosteroid isomerase-like protein
MIVPRLSECHSNPSDAWRDVVDASGGLRICLKWESCTGLEVKGGKDHKLEGPNPYLYRKGLRKMKVRHQ